MSPYRHYDYMMKHSYRLGRACIANDVTYEGECFNCGYTPAQGKDLEATIRQQEHIARIEAINAQLEGDR